MVSSMLDLQVVLIPVMMMFHEVRLETTQEAQYGLMKEYSLNYTAVPNMINSIFVNLAILGSPGTKLEVVLNDMPAGSFLKWGLKRAQPHGSWGPLQSPPRPRRSRLQV